MKNLTGKIAVVTASTAGIGYGIALRLGLEGCTVVVSSRKQKNVDEAVQKLQKVGIEAVGKVCHVASSEQRKSLADFVKKRYARIDIFISNAAVNPALGPILDMGEKELDKVWDINVKAAILLVKEFAPHIPKGGCIVFVSSISAFSPLPLMGLYSMSKTALLGLTKVLAGELGPDVRVNCVAPGIVPTHFADFIVRNEAAREEAEGRTAIKRLGTPEDMASAVAFLASDDASYITGEILVVAGGMQSRL